jgi:hypothetical protein
VALFGARTRVDPVQLARASALLRPFLA